MSSILCTASVPGFEPSTGGVVLVGHHLVSSQLSLAASFHPDHRLVLDPPPTIPYQSTSVEADAEQGGRQRRKRRKLDPQAATPADWAGEREKDARLSVADRETRAHHAEIEHGLGSAIGAVRDEWGPSSAAGGWLGESADAVVWAERKRDASSKEIDWITAQTGVQVGKQAPLKLGSICGAVPLADVVGRLVFAPSTGHKALKILVPGGTSIESSACELVLPPSSAFLLADFSAWSAPSSGIAATGSDRGGWDLLLLDPPWPNASASRSAAYDTFDAFDLWKLDVKALLGDQGPCLIAVWLTNKVKFRRLVLDKLFPAWGITEAPAEWYWVKITDGVDGVGGGEPVWKLDGVHRRCYEGLVIGYYNPTGAALPALPLEKVFLSTPLGHSRKPVLLDLLRPFLLNPPSRPPNVLELFARTALAGPLLESTEKRGIWLAVGNEAIKFNVLDSQVEGGVKGWLQKGPRGV